MTIEGLEAYIRRVLTGLGYTIVPEGMKLTEDFCKAIIDLLHTKYKIYVAYSPAVDSLDKYCSVVRKEDPWEIIAESRPLNSRQEAVLNGIAVGLSYVKRNLDAGIIVAIDGYPACGKSTIAKRLALKAGYLYIDSGAMYRSVALYYSRTKEEINEDTIRKVNVSFETTGDGVQRPFLNGEDVTDEIRTLEIGSLASKIGVNDIVREYLGKQQRELGKIGGVVMDGRDIGTVVFPNAQLKLFMTANIGTRIGRRVKDINSSRSYKEAVSWDEVSRDIRARDYYDVDQFNGKRLAEDAIKIDNTSLDEDEQFDLIWDLFKQALVNYRLKDKS